MTIQSERCCIIPRGLLFAALIPVVCNTPALHAQSSDEAPVIEEIVVTGSRIPRRDFASISPIATLERETFLFSGEVTLEGLLNQLPQITPDFGRTSNNPGDGTARINLRGLGSGRTLVLLNGRRVVPSGSGSAVDINNLPQALIEKVEVITGGATAVYGSDAVAGAVNFITRRDFNGISLETSLYTTEEGDSNIIDVNIAFGSPLGDRGHITLFGGWLERDSTLAGDRSLTAVPLINLGGQLVAGGSTRTPAGVVLGPPADLGNGPVAVTFTTDGIPVAFQDPADRYNYARLNYLQAPLDRTSAGMFFEFAFNDRTEVYTEFSFTRNSSKRNLAPVPLARVLVTNTNNPVLTPQAQQVFADNYVPVGPDTVLYFLGRRLEELGPRIVEQTADYGRVVAGLRGDFPGRWEYDAWLSYTRGDEESLLLNDVSFSRIQQGLLVDPVSNTCFDTSGNCVPINLFGAGSLDASALAFVRLPALVNQTDRDQKLVSAFVQGPLFKLPGGDVRAALGAEWRSDDGKFSADPALFTGDAVGYRGSASVDGSESLYELFAEAVVPLLAGVTFAEYLGFEFGARYSRYENAGSLNTWKIGADWQPVEPVRLRVLAQRSARAPNLAEAFQEEFTETFSFVGVDPDEDPCSASADPVGSGNVEKCIATGLPADQIGTFEAAVGIPTSFTYGGNPNLVPEEANTLTAGVVFTPHSGLSIAFDYFDLEVDHTINRLVSTVACFDPANTSNRFCDTFRRDPNTFDVVELRQINVNLGSLHTRGVDTQFEWRRTLDGGLLPATAGANVSAHLLWTRVFENSVQAIPGGSRLDCVGAFGWPCTSATDGQTFPRNRVTSRLRYSSGDFSANLTWRWIDGTDNAEPRQGAILGTQPGPIAIESIGSKNYLDLGVGYRFSPQFAVRLHVANALDTDAPVMADAVASNNTDAQLFDVFGRSYLFSMTADFR